MDRDERERRERNKKVQEEIDKVNSEILQIPSYLTDDEKIAYEEIVKILKESIKYRLSHTDVELIWQYCQIKIMRDRAWREYNKKRKIYKNCNRDL